MIFFNLSFRDLSPAVDVMTFEGFVSVDELGRPLSGTTSVVCLTGPTDSLLARLGPIVPLPVLFVAGTIRLRPAILSEEATRDELFSVATNVLEAAMLVSFVVPTTDRFRFLSLT